MTATVLVGKTALTLPSEQKGVDRGRGEVAPNYRIRKGRPVIGHLQSLRENALLRLCETESD